MSQVRSYQLDRRSYNVQNNLKPGYWLDMREDTGDWRIARVISVGKEPSGKYSVTVRMDGYSSKYTDKIKLPTESLAPLHRWTPPYTGPPKRCDRDELVLTVDLLLQHRDRMDKVARLEEPLDCEYISQYVRAELYIFIDTMLAQPVHLKEKDYKEVMNFLQTYVRLAVQIIRNGLEIVGELGDYLRDLSWFTVHPKLAYLLCSIELIDSLGNLVRTNNTRFKFHKEHQDVADREEVLSKLKAYMIENGVLEVSNQLLNVKLGDRTLPWCLRKGALTMLHLLGSQPELPEFDIRDAADLFDLIFFFGDHYPQELVEARHISLIFELIYSTNFERKLKGLNELKNLIDKTQLRARTEKLTTVLRDRNLVDYLTDNNNFNSELFKRSTPVFEFCIRQKCFRNEHLDRIVYLSRSRHESDLRLIYQALADLAKQLPPSSLDYLYSKLIELEVDDLLLVLLREFTANALSNLNGTFDAYTKRKLITSEKYGLFGLPQLWLYCQDESTLNGQLTLLAVNEFVQLLLSDFCRQEREKYVTLCLRQIQKGVSFAQSLRVVQLLIKEYSLGIISDTILRIDREVSVVESATQTLSKIISKELSPCKVTLDQCIENYFNFLEEISQIIRKSLSSAHVKTFWRMPKKDHLLNFLRKTRETHEKEEKAGRQFEKRLDSIFIRELIDSIFLVPELMQNYRNMDFAVYQTIDELLMAHNIRNKSIEYNFKNTIRILKGESIEQTFYFRVLLAENSEKVVDAAMRRLVDLNIRPQEKQNKTSDATNKIVVWAAFTDKLFTELSKQPHVLLRVFRYFLEAIEGRMKSLNFFSTTPVNLVVKLLEPEQVKIITLPSCSSIYRLRLKINEQFDLKHTDFEIYLKQNDMITNFQTEEDFSLLMIQNNAEPPNTPNIIIRPSKELHPHRRAIERFHEQLAQTRIATLYEMLDQLPPTNLALIFEILFKLPKLKSLQKKLLKLELGDGGWGSILSANSLRKLYYQMGILQANKNPKWVMQFIQKKGVQHMIQILVKIEPQALGEDFNLRCCSLLIQLLSEYIRFLNNPSSGTLDQIFSELVQLMQASVQYAGPLTMDFLVNGFRLLNSLIIIKPGATMMFYRHKFCKSILQYALFTENRKDLSQLFHQGLKRDIENQAVREIVLETILGFLNVQFLGDYRVTCDTYFAIVNKILEMSPKQDWLDKGGLLAFLSNFLQAARKLAYQEKSSNDFDALLGGWLTMTALVQRRTNLSIESIMKEKQLTLAEWLLHDCLFPPLDKSQSAKCKSLRNRVEAFNILNLLPTTKDFCMQEISKLFVPILSKSAWRRSGEWAITVSNDQPREFRGLKNMGATCYINSLMQQLFHLKEFREELLKVEPGEDQFSRVLFEVQKSFAYLQHSDSQSYVPRSFCQSFRVDGQPIDPRMQMDADQFFNNLMDKLDNALKQTKQQHIISSVFQGELSNQLICEGCPHFSERSEDYLSLGVTIKNKPSLEQALKEFIKGEVLDGDNAYYCEKCQKKVRCLKRACIKQLPNVLMIVLKRFQFNFDTMEKIKLNDYCEFPQKLDMKPYTKEFLHNAKEPGEATFRNEDYYHYELKGTVVHHGTSEAGHYYSYIRIAGEDRWMEFNDEWVDKFDINDLKDETFGGAEELFEGEKKAKNAYILFYERKKHFINGEPTPTMIQALPKPVINKALQNVEQDNLKNEYVRVAFDSNLSRYLLTNMGQNEGKMALLYYHLVVMRSKERIAYFQDYYNSIEKLLRKDSALAEWYLAQIGEPFLREFLFDAVKEVKYAVLSVIAVALKNSKVCPELVKRCMNCLNRRGMTPFAKIFYLMSTTSKEYVKLLKEHDYPNKVLRIMDGQQSTVKHPHRPLPSEFGESAGWDELSKEDPIDFNMLIHSLEVFDVRYEDIKKYCTNRIKTSRSSLAKIIARQAKQRDYFQKTFQAVLLNDLIKTDEQRDMTLYVRIIRELADVKDEYSDERLRRLAEVHVTAMKEHLSNYQYFNILIDALIRICSSNLAYRAKVVQVLADNKFAIFRQFKKWLEDSASPAGMIQSSRWTLWRRQMTSTQSKNYNMIMNNLASKEPYLTKRRDIRMDRFGRLIDKQVFEVEDSVDELEWPVGAKYEYMSSFGKLVTFEVTDRAGLLYLIKIDGGQRWVPCDEEISAV